MSRGFRVAGWSFAGLLLILPLIAMQLTDEVVWTASDFVFFGLMLAGVGVGLELAWAAARSRASFAGAAVALFATFFLVWVNLAVGMIGSEDHPANLLHLAVPLIGLSGAAWVRFQAAGVVRVLVAMAAAQMLVSGGAAAAGLGRGSPNWPLDMLGSAAIVACLWLLSAFLFARGAEGDGRAHIAG